MLALVWLGLNGADWSSWMVGLPALLAATWISVKLSPASPWRWSPGGAFRFAGYFLRESLRGAWEVACMALAPRLRLRPALVCYECGLSHASARFLFCNAISLLPGTAVVAMQDRRITVHVLRDSPAVAEELRSLELRVADMFGIAATLERRPGA